MSHYLSCVFLNYTLLKPFPDNLVKRSFFKEKKISQTGWIHRAYVYFQRHRKTLHLITELLSIRLCDSYSVFVRQLKTACSWVQYLLPSLYRSALCHYAQWSCTSESDICFHLYIFVKHFALFFFASTVCHLKPGEEFCPDHSYRQTKICCFI